MALIVPPPTLSQEGATGNRFVAEKPIQLSCGPVTFPDGASLIPENAVEFGFLLYREEAGGTTKVWDEEAQSWLPESASPDPQSLFYRDDKWQSILVAIGQKDKANQDKFGTNRLTGFPKYSARCFFRGKDVQGIEHIGASPKSQAVEVLGFGERDRAGLAIEPKDKDPSEATRIYLFLRDASLTERGRIVIREQGGAFRIELVVNGTRLALTSGGDIVLSPSPGHVVRVEGDVLVNGNLTAHNVP
ncbi:MAG: hypothetical protein ACE5LU_17590 [Anaerolineae bacterium]